MDAKMKKALFVGLNYIGTTNELRGCENDIIAVQSLLYDRYGYDVAQRRMLSGSSGTTEAILERLKWLVDGAKPGDTLLWYYSGHGSQVACTNYDTHPDDEDDSLHEIICPVDLDWRTNVILDRDLNAIFSKLDPDVSLTVIFDACHSATGIRSLECCTEESPVRERSLKMPTDIANRMFGRQSTPPRKNIMTLDPNQQRGILLAACQDWQTAADSWSQRERKYHGAFTAALLSILRDCSRITYATLIERLTESLTRDGYDQRPQLGGRADLFGSTFLGV